MQHDMVAIACFSLWPERVHTAAIGVSVYMCDVETKDEKNEAYTNPDERTRV